MQYLVPFNPIFQLTFRIIWPEFELNCRVTLFDCKKIATNTCNRAHAVNQCIKKKKKKKCASRQWKALSERGHAFACNPWQFVRGRAYRLEHFISKLLPKVVHIFVLIRATLITAYAPLFILLQHGIPRCVRERACSLRRYVRTCVRAYAREETYRTARKFAQSPTNIVIR